MEEGDNLERWTKAPKEGGLQAWEKRVLVSQWAGAAWDKLCETYDFEASATRMGMLMTADGSDDDKICVQGVAEYSFTDAEGGPEGAESDDEVDEADEADVADGEVDDGEEYDDGLEDSDEEDDTREEISLEEVSLCGGSPAEPPAGFVYAPACPPLDSLDDKAALVGKTVQTHNKRLVRRLRRQVGRGQEGEEGAAEGDAHGRVQQQTGRAEEPEGAR